MSDRENRTRRLRELENRARSPNPSGTEKQHAAGKLTARERIDTLMDAGSFVEEFQLAESSSTDFGMAEKKQPGDGVVVGFGKVAGRLTYVFAQDYPSFAGTVGSVHAEKIAYAVATARKMGAPVVGLYDSAGARIQEGLDVTRSIGRIFYENTITSGVVPQISAIMGPCIGVAAYSPALTDFVVMVAGTGQMFITGPSVIKDTTGEDVTMEELGGARLHAETSGVADLVVTDDAACLDQIRDLLEYLPSSNRGLPPVLPSEDGPNRRLEDLDAIVPEDFRKPYDVREVVARIVDGGRFLEIKAGFAPNIVIGFGRLNGRAAGFVANQPQALAGSLDVDASDKAARFIRLCDAFNIPIVTLVDVPGYLPGSEQERMGIIRHGAKLLYAYAESTVPKITLYLRKGYGGAKQAMCTREMGADQVLVWPNVELAVMGSAGAVGVLHRREIQQSSRPEETRRQRIEEFEERFGGPFEAVRKQYAHAAILPADTRVRLIQCLEMLQRKDETRPEKKHGIMPV